MISTDGMAICAFSRYMKHSSPLFYYSNDILGFFRARQENKPALRRAYNGKCGDPSRALKGKPRPNFYQMTDEIRQKLQGLYNV